MDVAELTESEREVWAAFAKGLPVRFLAGETVRAEVLVALLLGVRPAEPGHIARLTLSGATVTGPLDLRDAEITAPIALTECELTEQITLDYARIRRLDLTGSSLPRLQAKQVRMAGDLVLRSCRITGGIDLAGATVDGIMVLNHLRVSHEQFALHAPRLTIEHSIYGADLQTEGGIFLPGAQISGGLHLREARLTATASEDEALNISRASIGDDVNLTKGSEITGLIRMTRTHIRGQLTMTSARLVQPGGGRVWKADNLRVDQNVNCAELEATGEIRLVGAQIGGDLVLSGARLDNPDGYALDAGHLEVSGGLRCDSGFAANGAIRLVAAEIDVLELQPAEPLTQDLDLRHARLRILRDDPAMIAGAAQLDGLDYSALDPVLGVPERLDWLSRQPEGYRPQPYEQLAATYRRLGQDADARRVLLAKQRQRRTTLPPVARLWGRLQDWMVGYGYLPARAAGWLLALLAIGTAVFATHRPNPVQPGPPFNPLVYTLDVLLPVVKLGQEQAFSPAGPVTQWCGYLLLIAGWVLATTIAAAISRTLTRN
ncbi:hypothetical protein D5S17_10470 [Pseudonocardiaceae bacterium YIM PH 21723]|nr:hypothetical protein D5S17_10470 [Pseudonocardiaceae bacterium YIM PH 21723]